MLLRESVVPSLLLWALWMSALGSRTKKCGSQDAFSLLEKIKNQTPSWEQDSETRLYTPTWDHYQRCPNSTLSCMRSEMKMLLDEWNITDKKLTKILSILQFLIKQTQHQESGCVHVRCENFPEEPAMTFLSFLNVTLQQINAACPTAS